MTADRYPQGLEPHNRGAYDTIMANGWEQARSRWNHARRRWEVVMLRRGVTPVTHAVGTTSEDADLRQAVLGDTEWHHDENWQHSSLVVRVPGITESEAWTVATRVVAVVRHHAVDDVKLRARAWTGYTHERGAYGHRITLHREDGVTAQGVASTAYDASENAKVQAASLPPFRHPLSAPATLMAGEAVIPAPAPAPELLTAAEHQAMDMLAALWNHLCSEVLPVGTARSVSLSVDADTAELVHHVHALQRAVLANAAARAYPNRYRTLGGMVTP